MSPELGKRHVQRQNRERVWYVQGTGMEWAQKAQGEDKQFGSRETSKDLTDQIRSLRRKKRRKERCRVLWLGRALSCRRCTHCGTCEGWKHSTAFTEPARPRGGSFRGRSELGLGRQRVRCQPVTQVEQAHRWNLGLAFKKEVRATFFINLGGKRDELEKSEGPQRGANRRASGGGGGGWAWQPGWDVVAGGTGRPC